jgi:PAS domain S-box-containing protein
MRDDDLEMLEHLNDIVVLLDGDGLVTHGNPAALLQLAYSREVFVGKHVVDLIHPGDLEGAIEAIGDLHAGGDQRHVAHRHRAICRQRRRRGPVSR